MTLQRLIRDEEPLVEVYQFMWYDIATKRMVLAKRWGTKEKINQLSGVPVEESKKYVNLSAIKSDIEGLTVAGYIPSD